MKAQVTLFMVLGLVILVAFALTLYVVSYRQLKDSLNQVPESVITSVNVESVRNYAEDCVYSSALDALILLGMQGGRLYKSQQSIANDPVDFIEYYGVAVSYSVLRPSGNVGPYTSVIPDYPWKDFPWIVMQGNVSEWFYGYFGLPDFPPLYDFSRNSVQEMIEVYVENKLDSCFDRTKFPGLSFQFGNPDVNMVISKNITQLHSKEFVSFVVDWPILITDNDNFRAEIEDFVVNLPLSFGNIYYHAKSLIDSDVSQIKFNPEEYSDFDVSVVRDVKQCDDVVVFADKRSNQKGIPFKFYIARKNRPPALVEISNKVSSEEFCIGTRFSVNNGYLIASNNQLNLKLRVFDPDEDVVSFHLSPENPKLLANSMSFRIIAEDDCGLKDYEDIVVYGVSCS